MGKGGGAQWGDGAFQADSSNAGGLYLCLFSLPLVAPAENFNPPTHQCNRL